MHAELTMGLGLAAPPPGLHGARPGGGARDGPGQPAVHCGRADSAVGYRYHRTPHRRRSEREEIAVLKAQGAGVREIARRLGRDPSTIRLREYVQERLSGQVRRLDGTPVPGPVAAPWKGRNKPSPSLATGRLPAPSARLNRSDRRQRRSYWYRLYFAIRAVSFWVYCGSVAYPALCISATNLSGSRT